MDEHKSGDNKDVNIATPFGGIHVKTDEKAAPGDIGLQAYPGATMQKKDGNDSGSADVNIGFGGFQMRVKAVSYRTPDPEEKVEAFYRTALKQYGLVIACRGDHAVGTPTQTAEGLTCDNKKGNHIQVNDERHSLELKAGSRQHQHVVSLDPEDGGTKFGLVALDLPGGMFSDGGGNGGDRQ